MKTVTAYTDGACNGNPGPGGFGVVLLWNGNRREISCGYRVTTNNRMELRAAIAALEALKQPCRVLLWSDSEYLIKPFTLGWLERWKRNGWKRDGKNALANRDLWERLSDLTQEHQVEWHWTRGHAGNPENERADFLARWAAEHDAVREDEGFEGGV
jgi:ribonuclease HI